METSNRNSRFSAASDASAARARSKELTRSTVALTGCISKLSVVERHEHAYFDALKDYAVHYAEAQAYLADAESPIVHDYAAIDNCVSEPDRGLLDDDGELVRFVLISDDDIDNCGYLGWLRH